VVAHDTVNRSGRKVCHRVREASVGRSAAGKLVTLHPSGQIRQPWIRVDFTASSSCSLLGSKVAILAGVVEAGIRPGVSACDHRLGEIGDGSGNLDVGQKPAVGVARVANLQVEPDWLSESESP